MQVVMLPGKLALTNHCGFLLNIPFTVQESVFFNIYSLKSMRLKSNGNVKGLSVNLLHFGIIWANNLFDPA